MDDQTRPLPGLEQQGPRVTRDEVLDTTRLRRSRDDRYVAGVAGGLARHFDIDPLLVRIVLVVLSLFGAAGLVLYAAVWLFVPEDGSDRAVVQLRADTLRLVLLGTLAVAAVLVLGLPWGEPGWIFWAPWPLLLVLAGAVWLGTRNRDRSTPPPPAPYDTASPTAPHAGPYAAAYAAPPRPPRRTGLLLFWPTLALVAIALGVVGVVDGTRDLPTSAYAAAALAVTGLGLLLGAFWGRPGGLIALGLVLTMVLGGTTVADTVNAFGPYGETRLTPDTAAGLGSETLRPDSGEFVLDLRDLDAANLEALDGRTIAVQMDVGELAVILPPGLGATVDGEVRHAGEVVVDGDVAVSGLGTLQSTTKTRPGQHTVELDLELGLGTISVRSAA